MKKILLIMLLLAACTGVCLLQSCTENARTRTFGGTEEVQLKPNEVLVNITWKETDMWVLTRDTITNISYFRESSSFGIWEGQVIVKP